MTDRTPLRTITVEELDFDTAEALGYDGTLRTEPGPLVTVTEYDTHGLGVRSFIAVLSEEAPT